MEENLNEESEPRRRGWRKVLWGTLAALVLVVAAGIALLPVILPNLTFDERTFDLAAYLPEDRPDLVTNRTASIRFWFLRSETRDLTLRARGHLLDWPYSLRVDFRYGLFAPRTDGVVSLRFDDTPWRIDGPPVIYAFLFSTLQIQKNLSKPVAL